MTKNEFILHKLKNKGSLNSFIRESKEYKDFLSNITDKMIQLIIDDYKKKKDILHIFLFEDIFKINIFEREVKDCYLTIDIYIRQRKLNKI